TPPADEPLFEIEANCPHRTRHATTRSEPAGASPAICTSRPANAFHNADESNPRGNRASSVTVHDEDLDLVAAGVAPRVRMDVETVATPPIPQLVGEVRRTSFSAINPTSTCSATRSCSSSSP